MNFLFEPRGGGSAYRAIECEVSQAYYAESTLQRQCLSSGAGGSALYECGREEASIFRFGGGDWIETPEARRIGASALSGRLCHYPSMADPLGEQRVRAGRLRRGEKHSVDLFNPGIQHVADTTHRANDLMFIVVEFLANS